MTNGGSHTHGKVKKEQKSNEAEVASTDVKSQPAEDQTSKQSEAN